MRDGKIAAARSIDDGLLCLFREEDGETPDRLALGQIAERWKRTGLRLSDLFSALDRLEARFYVRTVATDDEIGIAITRSGREHLAAVAGGSNDCWAGASDQAVYRMTGRHRSGTPTPGRYRRMTDMPVGLHH